MVCQLPHAGPRHPPPMGPPRTTRQPRRRSKRLDYLIDTTQDFQLKAPRRVFFEALPSKASSYFSQQNSPNSPSLQTSCMTCGILRHQRLVAKLFLSQNPSRLLFPSGTEGCLPKGSNYHVHPHPIFNMLQIPDHCVKDVLPVRNLWHPLYINSSSPIAS